MSYLPKVKWIYTIPMNICVILRKHPHLEFELGSPILYTALLTVTSVSSLCFRYDINKFSLSFKLYLSIVLILSDPFYSSTFILFYLNAQL